MCTIFEDVGNRRLSEVVPKNVDELSDLVIYNRRVLRDYLGFTFYCAADQFISIAIG